MLLFYFGAFALWLVTGLSMTEGEHYIAGCLFCGGSVAYLVAGIWKRR